MMSLSIFTKIGPINPIIHATTNDPMPKYNSMIQCHTNHTKSSTLLLLLEETKLRQLLQWLVDFHYRQNSQTSLAFLVSMSSAKNQNCLPNLRMDYSKMATSRGAHLSNTEHGVTGLIRMSRSLFLQRWFTVSRYSSIGFFFFSGLDLYTSVCGAMTCRMGSFFSLRLRRRGVQGCDSERWLALSICWQSWSKSGRWVGMESSTLSFFCGDCIYNLVTIYKYKLQGQQLPYLLSAAQMDQHRQSGIHGSLEDHDEAISCVGLVDIEMLVMCFRVIGQNSHKIGVGHNHPLLELLVRLGPVWSSCILKPKAKAQQTMKTGVMNKKMQNLTRLFLPIHLEVQGQ